MAPPGLAFDAAGNLYVANTNAGTVSEFSATGASKGTFAFGLSDPIGLAFDAAGNLYVANNVAGTVSEFSATGTSKGTFASGLSEPRIPRLRARRYRRSRAGRAALTLAGIGLATLLGYGWLRLPEGCLAALTPRRTGQPPSSTGASSWGGHIPVSEDGRDTEDTHCVRGSIARLIR